MGQFIDEVSKINRSQNRADSVMQRKNNLKNEIYKFFNRAFKHSDDIDFTYEYYLDDSVKSDIMCGKTKSALSIYDACYGLTMEFCNTTYFSQLDKIYKLFKKRQDISIKNAEKIELFPLDIILDYRGRLQISKTFENHVKKNACYREEKIGDKTIKYYKILDNDECEYDFKVFFYENGLIDNITTYAELRKSNVLDGVKMPSSAFSKVIVALMISALLVYMGANMLFILFLIFLFIIMSV